MVASKAKRSAAAKKAARTRKKNKTKRSATAKKAARTKRRKKKNGVTSAVAKKAYAAGRGVEKKYAAILRKNHDQAHVGSGIPDILAHDRKDGWKFYEIKPHMTRRGYSKKGTWHTAAEKSRLLNKHQMSVFHKLVSKREDVNIVYYYRKRYGSKTKPKYKYKYREVKLRKSHFKSSKGPDPEKMSPIPEDIQRWMEKRIV